MTMTTEITDLPQREKHPREHGRFVPVPLTPSSGYFTRHDKVKYTRGSARQFSCSCGQQARHWATLHDRSGLDIWSDYSPMCVRCHMLYDGTSICLRHGEDVASAKLTAARVLELREMHATGGWSARQLAVRFGVSEATVYHIVARSTWRWLA